MATKVGKYCADLQHSGKTKFKSMISSLGYFSLVLIPILLTLLCFPGTVHSVSLPPEDNLEDYFLSTASDNSPSGYAPAVVVVSDGDVAADNKSVFLTNGHQQHFHRSHHRHHSPRSHRQIRHLHQQQRRHAAAPGETAAFTEQESEADEVDENGDPFLNTWTRENNSDPGPSHDNSQKQASLIRQSSSSSFEDENNVNNDNDESFPMTIQDHNFPDGYWVRIAQAKVLALAVENGTLPRLNEYSQIMNPAGCRKDYDKECSEFTSKCAEDKATLIITQNAEHHIHPTKENVTFYMQEILRECNFKLYKSHGFDYDYSDHLGDQELFTSPLDIPSPLPVFHCNSYVGQHNVQSNFRMEYPPEITKWLSWGGSTLLPENLTSNVIPRYFVVELSHGGKWSLPYKSVQAYWLFRFNTFPDHAYQIRVTAVSPKYVYPPVTSPVVKIYSSSELTVDKPKNLHVVNISIDDRAARPKPSALLRWQSGSGLNASCDYDVFYMDDDIQKVERKKGDEAFWVKLDMIHFERNYSVRVIEKFGSGLEAEIVSGLYIPSCLEMRRFSFDMCRPPPPRNVHLENATEHSFWIVWNPPKYVNETNRILHYNLTVDWIYSAAPVAATTSPVGVSPDGILHGGHTSAATAAGGAAVSHQGQHRPTSLYNTHKIFSGNVPGNVTAVLIKNVTQLRGQFKVSVTAVGAAGPSDSTWDVLYYKGTPLNDWTIRKILTLVMALFGVVGLIVLFCVLKHLHERRQRKKKRQETFENYERESLQLQQFGERDATKWEIECCNLDLREGIGQGNFGLVRLAILNQKGKKMTVAVKTARDGVDSKDVEKLWEEYDILKNLDPHIHVVGLKGIVTKHVPQPLLVVEYCDGGDLQSHLRKVVEMTGFSGARRYSPGGASATGISTCSSSTQGSTTLSAGSSHSSIVNLNNAAAAAPPPHPPPSARIVTNAAYFLRSEVENPPPGTPLPPPPLTIADLLSYARQVACGMEYLSSNKIIHRDLAARNILLSGKSRILKISDFGLSRDVYEQNWYKKTSKEEIPFKWLAIESILNEIYTTKSDVWSYGILLWEIFTYGGNPYPGAHNMKVFELLKTGYRMERPDTCPVDLYQLMRLCWYEDPNDRPDFTGIRLILEDIIEKTTHVTYLNLESSSSSNSTKGPCPGSHYYKNCGDSGFEEYDGTSGSTAGTEPVLPPRNKKKFG